MPETFVAYRLDLLLYVLLSGGIAWASRRLVPPRAAEVAPPRWFVPGLALLLLAGTAAAHLSGEAERRRLHDLLQDIAPTYADAMMAMGLMELGPDSAADHPVYRRIDAAQEQWLAGSRVAADIYVLMRLDDGQIVHIIDSETDFDRDGLIDHPEEQRTPIGAPYTDDAGEIQRAFLEKGRFSGEVYADAWGDWVSAYVWLWNEQRALPMLVGVDYRARDWLLAIAQERGLVLSTFLLLVGVLALGARGARLARAELDAEHAVQETLRLERARADEANRAKTQFLAAMSHEIRTPMSGVLGMIELMRHGRLDAEQREQVDTAFHSAHALLDILNDVLDFSRIESGALRLDPAPTAFPALVDELVRLHFPAAARKALALSSQVDVSASRTLLLDAGRIRQLINNLLSNALKFTATGSVHLRAQLMGEESGGGRLRVEVRDTGIGVSPDKQAHIFESFTQADETILGNYGGTGLGLAICRRLVEAMGGEIGVESLPGMGSLFWFEVPTTVLPDLPVPAASVPTPRPGSEGTTPSAGVPQAPQVDVLVVEDNEINQRVILGMLRRLGYSAELAQDGEQALECMSRQAFRVVLMDMQLPGVDGLEATRRWRAGETAQPHLPIIALTANAMSSDREACLLAGMDDFLGKPVEMLQLQRLLERWVGTPAGGATGPD